MSALERILPQTSPPMNRAPEGFTLERDLPAGFAAFYTRLHETFTHRQQALAAKRITRLAAAHEQGELPRHLPASPCTQGAWRIEVPSWCQDQRNQMTGPADDAELVVKMLNSGAPGVMLDLEDSMANTWDALQRGVANVHASLAGALTYDDAKRGRTVSIAASTVAIWTRVRGLHLSQAGVMPGGALTSASLFDLALVTYSLDAAQLMHPLGIYIPKSESAEEALWWRDVFQAIAAAKGWPKHFIRCMALVESHPLAFEMEEFLFGLRDHIVGLNLGRWDYMASLIHWNLRNPAWVLPDRNTIPHDVPFFQSLRKLLVNICHSRGALAIGGMTALYPSRADAELNARALAALENDKHNEAACGMDGAWTGHPDQNAIAVAQFPQPNQLSYQHHDLQRYPDLRPVPAGVGRHTMDGTRAASRTAIRYRDGVLRGNGASLLDGYMEDLATDRIYRLMLTQRVLHREQVTIVDRDGAPVLHDDVLLTQVLDQELATLTSAATPEAAATLRLAREQSERMIVNHWHDPV